MIYYDNKTSESAFFFNGSGDRKLFGFLHHAKSLKSTTGIVYCHPFAEEKNMSHSVIVKTARKISHEGFPVFRFDMSGCGDSEGDLEFATIQDWEQDLRSAIEIFSKKTGVTNCILWGLRTGAGLALLQEQYRKDVSGLILWQPVIDYLTYIKQFLRRNVSTQIIQDREEIAKKHDANVTLRHDDITHVIGYPISKALFSSFSKIEKKPSEILPSVPTLLISISMMNQPTFALKQYSEWLKETNAKLIFEHVIAEPFWDRYWQWECNNVTDVTLHWLQQFR